ncbi:MAG TPA: hypothetical protein GXZ82_01020 [Firmicutes bacterium]|nr:hypothetical protein [Bacillota bacterium]
MKGKKAKRLDWLDALALGVALGADSLSVSIGIGIGGTTTKRACKLAVLFGVLQGVLLAAGVGLAALAHWLLDTAAQSTGLMQRLVCKLDAVCVHHYIHLSLSMAGAVILCIVGVGLIRNYRRGGNAPPVYYKGRMALILLAFSVSIDAFSAGIGLGMLENQALTYACLIVALVIALMAFGGLKTGRRIGRLIGRRAELVGGILLVLLAIHLTLQVVLL